MTRELKLGSFVLQQNLGRLLGAVDYLTHSGCLEEATNCLLECVDPSNSRMKSNVEARRNCYLAIPKILATCLPKLSELLSSQVVTSLYEALQQGLSDYTTDERGDVGSWIRIACIQGLTTISEMLSSNGQAFYTISTDHDDTSPACDLRKYLPPRQYHKAANGILKQGVERLDNVRQEAGEAFTRLMKLQTGDRGPNDEKTKGTSEWDLPGFTILDKLFLQDTEDSDWGDGRWLFPKAIHLLDIPEYRDPVLSGLIISLGSRSQSTHKPLADSLLNYVGSLPTLGGDGGSPRWSVKGLVEELLSRAKPHFTHNASVIPILNFINTIIDGEGMRNLASSGEEGVALLSELLGLASRNATRLKSVVRIQETMKIIVTLATYPELFKMSVNKLHPYLGHPYPTIRSETAEYLYLSLQGTEWDVETDDVEEILLETAWSTESIEDCLDASKRIVQLLLL